MYFNVFLKYDIDKSAFKSRNPRKRGNTIREYLCIFYSADNDTQLQATQTHTLFRLQSGRTMAVVKKGTTCLLILAYCVYFSFAMVMNFQKAIPLLCITVFACFCIFYTFTKRKFGHLIANPWQCNTIRRFWTSKSKKISMYV